MVPERQDCRESDNEKDCFVLHMPFHERTPLNKYCIHIIPELRVKRKSKPQKDEGRWGEKTTKKAGMTTRPFIDIS
jgi:hypothetical protein